MQLLKPIKVGQAPNDQTGDTLRDAMVVVNENFTKTRSCLLYTSPSPRDS